MFVGWEGVGLASYLLIGFFFPKDSAANAGKKAFIVNRIGDFGFLIALFLMIQHFGSLDFTPRLRHRRAPCPPETGGAGLLTAIGLLLLVGACGKSAQIPLYVWLPDAMEGPTPVSALIHAATMVTAGVYMVARSIRIFNRAPIALTSRRDYRNPHRSLCRHHRHHPDRHQARPRLLHRLPTRLYVHGLRCGRHSPPDLPPHDPRLLQGPCSSLAPDRSFTASAASRTCARWAASARTCPGPSGPCCIATLAIAGIPPFAGFFSKDEILWKALAAHGASLLAHRRGHRLHDLLLHVPADLMTFSGEYRGAAAPVSPRSSPPCGQRSQPWSCSRRSP